MRKNEIFENFRKSLRNLQFLLYEHMTLTVLITLLKGWYSCKVVFANGNGNMVETGNKIKSLIWTTISKIEWANRKFGNSQF